MQDPRVALAELLSAGITGLGAALLIEPEKCMGMAGVALDGNAVLFTRMVGLRDLTLGSALLQSRERAGRMRQLRTIAAMCAVETALLLVFGDGLSNRSLLLVAGSTAIAGVQALLASTSDESVPSGGALLLTAGYALAVPPALRLAPVMRGGDLPRFAAYEAGAVLIALGWWRRKNRLSAINNAMAATGGAAWWALSRSKQRRPLAPLTTTAPIHRRLPAVLRSPWRSHLGTG